MQYNPAAGRHKIKYLFITFLTTLFVAASCRHSEEFAYSEQFVGTWSVNEYKYKNVLDTTVKKTDFFSFDGAFNFEKRWRDTVSAGRWGFGDYTAVTIDVVINGVGNTYYILKKTDTELQLYRTETNGLVLEEIRMIKK